MNDNSSSTPENLPLTLWGYYLALFELLYISGNFQWLWHAVMYRLPVSFFSNAIFNFCRRVIWESICLNRHCHTKAAPAVFLGCINSMNSGFVRQSFLTHFRPWKAKIEDACIELNFKKWFCQIDFKRFFHTALAAESGC